MVASVDAGLFGIFGFLFSVMSIVVFLIMLILYAIPQTRDILRKRFSWSTERAKNATLTCKHGHKVRVYINIPGPNRSIYSRKPFNDVFWVDPEHCPICGGPWLMPDKHHHK